nr:immunoglobulin heavy chain junction region [Mus musculus]
CTGHGSSFYFDYW